MSSIVVRGVSLELANGRTLFSDLDFALGNGLTALVGPNGVGKTCLAKVIAGELAPTTGAVRRHGPVRLFPQRESPASVTVATYLADHEWSLNAERLLHGIDRDSACTALSGGQWMRVRLAHALNDDYLILDEPTNDLDREGRDAIAHVLRQRAGGTLVISHDRECLQLCEEIFELSNRGLMRFGGGWIEYLEARRLERERLSAALDTAKRERALVRKHRIDLIERQERRNRRGVAAAARGGMPKLLAGGRKRRAQVTTGTLDVTTLVRAEGAVHAAHAAFASIKVEPVMYADRVAAQLPVQKLVAEATGFNIRLGRWLYAQDLEFSWRGNVRVALKGANGSGKSTLLRALRGDAFETRGELRRGELATLYLDQRCSVLEERRSVFDNIQAVCAGADSDVRTALARFLFAGDAVFQKVSELSGGERLRAALARGFLGTRKPELLMLDEPTNNLDLANVEFLEGFVSEFRGAVAVVSHDESFLGRCGVERELVL
jgi:ATPase subunit of ABC transporter with duplicated ATPase domains